MGIIRKLVSTRTGEKVSERMFSFIYNVLVFKRGDVSISSQRKFFP